MEDSEIRREFINMPVAKSVYFCIRPLVDNTDFPEPWYYKVGVFDGQFKCVVGKGASGTVISGVWCGKKAAFKFVEIKAKKPTTRSNSSSFALKALDDELTDMIMIEATRGSKIVSFYGHYR